jgi:hypothetical protein
VVLATSLAVMEVDHLAMVKYMVKWLNIWLNIWLIHTYI